MRLFQYWDSGEPPDEVAGWIDGFRVRNPDFKHMLLNRDSASWFIGKHLGARERRAFEQLLVPSMQSDYLRTCALLRFGGVYADADLQCLRPLAGLIERAPRTFLLVFDHHIANGLLAVRRPDDAYLRACFEFATRNIELRRFADMSPRFLAAHAVAGPDVYTGICRLVDPSPPGEDPLSLAPPAPAVARALQAEVEVTPELREAVLGCTRTHVFSAAPWIGTEQPAYKQTERHWMKWPGAIYSDEGSERLVAP